jgi:hypothetical protein
MELDKSESVGNKWGFRDGKKINIGEICKNLWDEWGDLRFWWFI